MKVQYETMKDEIKRILLIRKFSEASAEIGATIISNNSLDGVYSHGLNRFPTIVEAIDKGEIHPDRSPVKVSGVGALEQWDGMLGFGPINATIAMDRAVALAKEYGIGCIALSNTNHWLRGGTYGLRAADQGCIGICMTNTFPNMPTYGGLEKRVGNNPFIMAVPQSEGNHLLLDMAQSQFSFGKLQTYSLAHKKLPVPGGYDQEGNLSNDPDAILKGGEVLPAGYWKGSGMAIAIDMVVAALSMGKSTYDLREARSDAGISQVFIAIDPRTYAGENYADDYLASMSTYLKSSAMAQGFEDILYPGERGNREHFRNLELGIPVDEGIWNVVCGL